MGTGPICTALLAWTIAPLQPGGRVPDSGTKKAEWAWIAIRVAQVIQIACNVGLVTSFGYGAIDSQGGKCVTSTNPNITYFECVKTDDCYYKWPTELHNSHDPRAAIPFILLCLGFFVQGFFSQRWFRIAGQIDDISEMPAVGFKICRSLGWFLNIVGLTAAATLGEVETEHYIYPIYSNTYCKGPYFGALHVMGTWAFLNIFYPLAKAYVNDEIHPKLYHYAGNSCFVVYGVHWIWLKVFAFWVVEPAVKYCNDTGLKGWWAQIISHILGRILGPQISWCPDEVGVDNPFTAIVIFLVVLTATLISSWATYWALLRCRSVGRLIGVVPYSGGPAPPLWPFFG